MAQVPYTYPVDVLAGLQSGQIAVSHSDFDIGGIFDVFDDDASSLARSANINPLVVTLEFGQPVIIASSDLLMTYGNGWWTLESANTLAELDAQSGSYQLLFSQAFLLDGLADSAPLGITARVLRLTLQRTTGDDYVHLNGWVVDATATVQLTGLCLVPNPIRLLPGRSFRLDAFGIDALGQRYPLPPDAPSWSSSDAAVVAAAADGMLTAGPDTGVALISVAFQTLLKTTAVKVVVDFTPLVAPSQTVKVALVVIDPPTPVYAGKRFHEQFGWTDPLALATALRDSLTAASAGVAQYEIIQTIDDQQLYTLFGGTAITTDSLAQLFLEPGWTTLHYVAEQLGQSSFDYNALLAANDFCAQSNAHEIDEVWVYSMPFLGMYESRLTGDGAFWYNSPPLSGNECTDQLPIMGLNYERGVAEAWHSYGHRVESAIAHLFGRWDAIADPKNAWELFTTLDKYAPGEAQVGNIHFPPNGISDYDYGNPATVSSYAVNWSRYPLLFDDVTALNCSAWDCDHLAFMSWWHRHLPHFACRDKNGFLNNWWAYIVDYAAAKSAENQVPACDCALFPETSGTQEQAAAGLRVFPNPATDRLVLDLPQGFRAGLLLLRSPEGRVRLRQNLQADGAAEISNLTPGLYFGELIDDLGERFFFKLIKQ